jgi:hypothetical protein
MENELARARRALGPVSGELDVTWDDVLARAKAGEESVPVLPLSSPRPPGPARARRVAVAAGLVAALALGISTASHLLVGRSASTPPAGSGSVATPHPVDSHVASSSDSAQVIVDRARDALRATPWCGADLQADDPRTALALDEGLEPTALDDARGKRSWTGDGERVTVDTWTSTMWKVESAADLLADRPDLQAAVAALRLLVDEGGTWRRAGDDTPDAITVDVNGTPVVVTVDAQTDLPTRLTTATPAGTFDVTWLSCDSSDDGPATVTVSPGDVGGSASP